jgi:hypothetical protein
LQILWHILPVSLKNHNFPTPSHYRKGIQEVKDTGNK